MAVIMVMKWKGMTLDRYEEVRKLVDWEGDQPSGGLLHVAAHDGEALRIVDLWASPAQFQAFVDGRLNAGLKQLGVEGQPDIEIFPVHALYTPGFTIPGA